MQQLAPASPAGPTAASVAKAGAASDAASDAASVAASDAALGETMAQLALGESVIKCHLHRTCSKMHTIIAVSDHVQMGISTFKMADSSAARRSTRSFWRSSRCGRAPIRLLRGVPLERVTENPKLMGKRCETCVFNDPF